MNAISKNVYIDKIGDIINKHNNIYHRTIKIKPIDVRSSTYIDFDIENNDNDPKLKLGVHVRILIYKNLFTLHIFYKGYTPYWSGEVFVIKKFKKLVPRTK